jgi:hypothetical protein
MRYIIIYLLAFIFLACSGLQKTEYDKIRKINITAKRITRKSTDQFGFVKIPQVQEKEPYFWENTTQVYLPKITKDFFRCKGHIKNAPKEYNKTQITDCNGSSKHSLPIIHGRENIYPVLIDILNYIQKKLRQKVVVTCGHRCPLHNLYSEPDQVDSWHMIGAEVDFYIKDFEDKAFDVIELIKDYYKNSELYQNKIDYTKFQRIKLDNLKTKAWVNKEICIKFYQKEEGRDYDNRHPYPYISIQAKYDRDLKEMVTYSKAKAEKNYYKW